MDLSNSPVEHSSCDNQSCTAGKTISPYADSPYVSYYELNGQEHPVKAGSQKARENHAHGNRKGSVRWLSALLVIVLVFGSCTATALTMNRSWQQKYDRLNSVMSNKLSAMQSMVENMTGKNNTVGTSVAPTEGMTPAQIYSRNEKAVVAISSDISTGTGFDTSLTFISIFCLLKYYPLLYHKSIHISNNLFHTSLKTKLGAIQT